MTACSYSHLANHVLRREMVASLAREHGSLAESLGYLAEFDARKLYVVEGYPSLYAFCLGELHLSEDAAYKRIQAARAARRFPAIFAAVAEGRLHLSAVCLLAPYLSLENSECLLAAAAHKTKAQVEFVLAQRFPRPDLETVVRALPSAPSPVVPALALPIVGSLETTQAPAQPVAIPTCQLAPAQVGTAGVPQVPTPAAPSMPHARITPLAPERYGVQFTMRGSTREKLRAVQELLGHAVPFGDLDLILSLALDALREKLERAKHAAVSQPRKRPSKRTPRGRHVPAEVQREVRQRDGNQCTYVSDKGHRCEARRDLELDHVKPFARGGESTVANLRLRCRTHNQLEAERVYGEQYMRNRRQAGLPGCSQGIPRPVATAPGRTSTAAP